MGVLIKAGKRSEKKTKCPAMKKTVAFYNVDNILKRNGKKIQGQALFFAILWKMIAFRASL